jgi:hypothetical protein
MYTVLQMVIFVGDGESETWKSRDRELEKQFLYDEQVKHLITLSWDVIQLHAEEQVKHF